jgi:predicted transcriptional regulator
MGRGGARPRGALGAEVLACLAGAGDMTPAQVQAELGGQLAYTTVMTTLSRLHRKGAIERSPAGRGFRYSLVGGPGRARSNMFRHSRPGCRLHGNARGTVR